MITTLGQGSEWCIAKDLTIIVSETRNKVTQFIFVFPRMNEVEVGEVNLSLSGSASFGEEPIAAHQGLFGRSVCLSVGSSVTISCLGVKITLNDSESARNRATFKLDLESQNPMETL